jgi:hypothetical protein
MKRLAEHMAQNPDMAKTMSEVRRSPCLQQTAALPLRAHCASEAAMVAGTAYTLLGLLTSSYVLRLTAQPRGHHDRTTPLTG